eukprot:1371843-Alexandrium_andersonii.AAC.1
MAVVMAAGNTCMQCRRWWSDDVVYRPGVASGQADVRRSAQPRTQQMVSHAMRACPSRSAVFCEI